MAEVIDSQEYGTGSAPLSKDEYTRLKEQEDKSLWVLIAAIAGFFVPFASLVAIILGFMYRHDPGLNGKGKVGFWIAIIYTVLSVIGVLLFVLFFIVLASDADTVSTTSSTALLMFNT